MINWPTHYYVLDFETTGLDANDCDIIEIGLVEVSNGKIINQWEELFNPGAPLSAKIQEITHINDGMLSGKKAPKIGMKPYVELINQTNIPIIAHNAPFDAGFLQKYCVIPLDFSRFICTAYLFKQFRKAHVAGNKDWDLPKDIRLIFAAAQAELANRTYQTDKVLFNLGAAINYLAIPQFSVGNRHRALADVKLTQMVFEVLKSEMH